MWDMQHRFNMDAVPARRVVVRFEFSDVWPAPLKRTWLVVDPPEVDVCFKDPGFAVDLFVTTSLRLLTRAWVGDVPLEPLLRSGEVTVQGPRELVRAFPSWLALSAFAQVDRPGARADV